MSDYVIRDPDFEARVRASFDAQGAMALMGIRLVSAVPGGYRNGAGYFGEG